MLNDQSYNMMKALQGAEEIELKKKIIVDSYHEELVESEDLDKRINLNELDLYEAKEIEYISKEEFDKIPDDYKSTVGETIKYSEARGENPEEIRKLYKDLGYDESDPMILARDDEKGTILKPVKIKEACEDLKEDNAEDVSKEERLASLKTQLETNGDTMNPEEKQAIQQEINTLENELNECGTAITEGKEFDNIEKEVRKIASEKGLDTSDKAINSIMQDIKDNFYNGIDVYADGNINKDKIRSIIIPAMDTYYGIKVGDTLDENLSNNDLEKLANDIIDWYDTDMGTHFDEVRGNEEEIYNETLGYLENKDINMINHFIDDITLGIDTDDKELKSSSKDLVNRLKALLNAKLMNEAEDEENKSKLTETKLEDIQMEIYEMIQNGRKLDKQNKATNIKETLNAIRLEYPEINKEELKDYIETKADEIYAGDFDESKKDLEESQKLNEADGWIAFYNGNKVEITKEEASDLWSAKQVAIQKLKVPKSKVSLVAIEPAYNESQKLKESAVVEQEVSNLKEVKSQGNIFMLQDDTKFIVGENYLKEEALIENAEIYDNKEDADKDYLGRCEITKDGEPAKLDESAKLNEDAIEGGSITEELNTGVLPIVDVDLYSLELDVPESVSLEDLDNLIMEVAPEYIEDGIKEVLPSAKVTPIKVYHPKQYNYSGDELEFNLTLNGDEYNALKEKTLADSNFENYLKDKYSSSSGFISTMPDNMDEFNAAPEWKQMVQVIMFNIPENVLEYENRNYLDSFLEQVMVNFPNIDDEDIEESVELDEAEEPFEAAKYKGKEWGIFAKKPRAWVVFGTEKEMKERAKKLNSMNNDSTKLKEYDEYEDEEEPFDNVNEKNLNFGDVNYKLPSGKYIHFHNESNGEGYYYEIYENGKEVDGGILIYSEVDAEPQTEQDILRRISELSGIKEIADATEKVDQKVIDELGESELTEAKSESSLSEEDLKNLLDNGQEIVVSKSKYTPTKFLVEKGKVYFNNREISFGWNEHPSMKTEEELIAWLLGMQSDGYTLKSEDRTDWNEDINESASVEEHNLSKDLFGDIADERMKQKQREFERDLQYVKDIMAGKEVIDDKYHEKLNLDTAKKWLRNDYVYLKGFSSLSPEEIDEKLARDLPEIFGK